MSGGTEVKDWLKISQELQETYNLIHIHWRENYRCYIRSKLKTCGSRAQYIKEWKSYSKAILKFTARTLWNMAQYGEEFKNYKKS